MTFIPVVRRATDDDAAALTRTGARLFLQAYDGLIPSRDMAVYMAAEFNVCRQQAELSDPEVLILIVETNDEMVGYAQLRQKSIPVDGVATTEVELQRIYVDQKWHGKGIAQQLISSVGEAVRSFSAHGIWLAVWEQNPRAISFYQKIGFEAVGNQQFLVHTQIQNDVIMRAPADVL